MPAAPRFSRSSRACAGCAATSMQETRFSTRRRASAARARPSQTRVDLERGRLRRSGGDPRDGSAALRVRVRTRARGASQHFIAADAAHMVALVATDRARRRRLDAARNRARRAPRRRRRTGSARSSTTSAGSTTRPAISSLRSTRSNARSERENAIRRTLRPIEIARYAVGKTLRGLGRADEAIPLLEQAVAWAEAEGAPDGWFHEELAEEYAAVGRPDDARRQARLALPLLERDDPSFSRGRRTAAGLACSTAAPGEASLA